MTTRMKGQEPNKSEPIHPTEERELPNKPSQDVEISHGETEMQPIPHIPATETVLLPTRSEVIYKQKEAATDKPKSVKR